MPTGPAAAYPDTLPRATIAGLPVVTATSEAIAAQMVVDARAARAGLLPLPRVIDCANGAFIARYHADTAFRATVDAADMIVADGMPLVFASRLFCRHPLSERTAITDFLLDTAAVAAREGLRFFFLGGHRGVAARAAEHLRSRFSGLQVVGSYHGFFDDDRLPAICAAIRARGTDVVWLGMGTPHQEIMALRLRPLLPGVAWVHTCGGLFTHYGGGVSRAPYWMQAAGAEWLYRAAREPLRLGWRYLATNPPALWHLLTKTHD